MGMSEFLMSLFLHAFSGQKWCLLPYMQKGLRGEAFTERASFFSIRNEFVY
jgi:hypothetical protein